MCSLLFVFDKNFALCLAYSITYFSSFLLLRSKLSHNNFALAPHFKTNAPRLGFHSPCPTFPRSPHRPPCAIRVFIFVHQASGQAAAF